MPTEAGQKMQQCLNAVCRMHSSVSKLLLDFDKYVSWPSVSVLQNNATKELTYATKAQFWMAWGVYRYLSCRDNPELVEGITVYFIDPDLDEPLVLMGRLEYADDPLQNRGICDGWDLWYIYYAARTGWVHNVPVTCGIPEDRATRIRNATLVSAPLYSISRIADIQQLLNSVRERAKEIPHQ